VIEHYYDDPATRDRHRSGPLGGHVDGFAAFLATNGYKWSTGRRYIRYVGYLSRWLADQGRNLVDVDDKIIADFVAAVPCSPYVRTNKGRFPDLDNAVRLFLRWLQTEGVLPTPAPPPSALAPIVEAFEAWMLLHRQVSTVTLARSYRPVLVRFIDAAGAQPEHYTAATIRGFILDQVVGVGRKKRGQGIATAVRMFLRYLATQGLCAAELVDAVPTVAHWKKEGLPKYISPAEVERILATCDQATTTGRRDFAILLALARLGLRASDVAGMRLSDLDWFRGHLWVCGKGRRREAMPLPQDVGNAVLAYLVKDRPVTDHDMVFVSLHAPSGPVGGGAVGTMVARRATAAGVTLPRAGSHVLRHSLATALLADGVSLAGIGSVLRHKDLDTTSIYAKVDVALLSTVARPWPLEVTP